VISRAALRRRHDALPVAIIGAGPVGLAAAAHLIQRGSPVKVYEAGATVGANVEDWATSACSRRGSTNTDTAARALLQAHGWKELPGKVLPTGSELSEAYLKPLAETPEMAKVI
jgi:2-polyprenyl-6-methoxyphenol hydroxylase-like FAD-dependent oxidoreductase